MYDLCTCTFKGVRFLLQVREQYQKWFTMFWFHRAIFFMPFKLTSLIQQKHINFTVFIHSWFKWTAYIGKNLSQQFGFMPHIHRVDYSWIFANYKNIIKLVCTNMTNPKPLCPSILVTALEESVVISAIFNLSYR